MHLSITDARSLAIAVLRKHRMTSEDAQIVTDHLIDAHLAGHTFAGLPRLLVILERMRNEPSATYGPVEVVHETPLSASIDGHGQLGYVVCYRAVDIALKKCRESKVAIVGAYNSYYSGRSGYYTERAAKEGMIAIHASSAFRMVAPTGGREPILGSNPLSMAFPTRGVPVVVDLSTAATTWGEIQLASAIGEQLPAGVAMDAHGQATRDPAAALLGAALPWGGHKGYALGVAVQLLGLIAGGDAVPQSFGNFGFFFLLFHPDLLLPREMYYQRVAELVDALHGCAVAPGSDSVKVPGERSSKLRARLQAEGYIEVPDAVYQRLLSI